MVSILNTFLGTLQDWQTISSDILIPCSTSGFIDTHTAALLQTKIVVGSSNAPFKDAAAQVFA